MKTGRNWIWFMVAVVWFLMTPMTAVAGEQCPACSSEPKGARFLVTFEDGRQQAYGCPPCAFSDIDLTKVTKMQATDFMSRSLIDARHAFYVKDSSYGECCAYWFAFASRQHAESFAKGFGGQVLTFDQALKTVGK